MSQLKLNVIMQLYNDKSPKMLHLTGEPLYGGLKGAPGLFWDALALAIARNTSTNMLVLDDVSPEVISQFFSRCNPSEKIRDTKEVVLKNLNLASIKLFLRKMPTNDHVFHLMTFSGLGSDALQAIFNDIVKKHPSNVIPFSLHNTPAEWVTKFSQLSALKEKFRPVGSTLYISGATADEIRHYGSSPHAGEPLNLLKLQDLDVEAMKEALKCLANLGISDLYIGRMDINAVRTALEILSQSERAIYVSMSHELSSECVALVYRMSLRFPFSIRANQATGYHLDTKLLDLYNDMYKLKINPLFPRHIIAQRAAHLCEASAAQMETLWLPALGHTINPRQDVIFLSGLTLDATTVLSQHLFSISPAFKQLAIHRTTAVAIDPLVKPLTQAQCGIRHLSLRNLDPDAVQAIMPAVMHESSSIINLSLIDLKSEAILAVKPLFENTTRKLTVQVCIEGNFVSKAFVNLLLSNQNPNLFFGILERVSLKGVQSLVEELVKSQNTVSLMLNITDQHKIKCIYQAAKAHPDKIRVVEVVGNKEYTKVFADLYKTADPAVPLEERANLAGDAPIMESTTKKSKTGDSDEDFVRVKTEPEPESDPEGADCYRFF